MIYYNYINRIISKYFPFCYSIYNTKISRYKKFGACVLWGDRERAVPYPADDYKPGISDSGRL